MSLYIAIKRKPIKEKVPINDFNRKIDKDTVQKIIMPDDDKLGKDKIKDLVGNMKATLNNSFYTNIRNNKTIPKNNINLVYEQFYKDLFNNIDKTLGTKFVKMGVCVRNFEEDNTSRKWNKIVSTHTKVLLAVAYATKYDFVPKTFKKMEKLKLSDPEYYLQPPAAPGSSPSDWLEYRQKVQKYLKKAKKNLNKYLITAKRKSIQDKVAEIRMERNSPTPNKFFKRTNPDSIWGWCKQKRSLFFLPPEVT
jgi:hypothetical protein